MLLIGSSRSRRTLLLRAALERVGVRFAVVEWRDLIEEESPERHLHCALLADHLWCKIDSPGEDAQVADALVRRGWRLSGSDLPAPGPLRHGELAYQHWWFAGFADLMTHIGQRLGSLRLLNRVSDILLMCDKWACQRHLRERALAVPELLCEVRTLDEIDEQFPARRYPALFIKARYGSSAAGVVALWRHPDGRMVAYTSARIDDDHTIYNHLRISRYTERRTVARLVDALASQGAYAERWMPKPRAPVDRDASYDLRVVASCGLARQRVARISRSPMTNLHLGNRRAPPHWLSASEVGALEEATARAAAAFSHSRCIGFDVNLRGHDALVLEANAFGDLLPGLQYMGMTAYDDQARLVSADER